MGMLGALAGGAGGFALGGPAGAAGGAVAGSWLDDQLGVGDSLGLGPKKPKPVAAPQATPWTYDHTGTKYKDERTSADARAGYDWDWGQTDEMRKNALAARMRQNELADKYQSRINGTAGPSLAEQQLRMGQERNMRDQLNAAASARGGGGAALAAQAAARQQGMLAGQQLNAEAGMMRTREQQEAEAAYASLLNSMRGADMAGQGMDMQRQGMLAQHMLANRGQNDARSLGLLQAQIEEQKAKAAAAAGVSGLNMQGQLGAMGANASADAAYRGQQAAFQGALIGAGGSFLGGYAASGGFGGGGAGAGAGGAPAGGGGGSPTGGGGYYYTDSYGQHNL